MRALLLGMAVFVAVSTVLFLTASVAGIDREQSFFLTVAGVPLFGTIIGFVLSLSLMRAIMKRAEGQLFRTHVVFVVRHFVPLMVVTLYLTIVTQVGYALFFLPGVAATIYFLFATPLTVAGEERGFRALSASVALVHGRFFPVLGRFLVVNLAVLGIALLIFLLGSGAVALSFVGGTVVDFVVFPFIFVAILALAIGTFFAATCGLITLFESLQATKSAAAPVNRQSLETFFRIVVGIVVALLAVLAFILGFAGYTLLNW